jgi:putative endopeptidase
MRTQHIFRACTILAAAILGGAISSCGPSGRQAYHQTLDLAALDTTVSPANDFFDYANGSWLKKATIPADKTAWGVFNIIEDTVMNRIKAILDSCSELKDPAKGSPARQIGDLYASQMDSTAIENAGLSPLRRSLDQIDSVASVGDLIRVISVDEMEGYGAPAPLAGWSLPTRRTRSPSGCTSSRAAWGCRRKSTISRPTPPEKRSWRPTAS